MSSDAGRFGADVLTLWESDHGTRKVGEWVALIETCEKAGVEIAVTTHGRCYDPANPRDRRRCSRTPSTPSTRRLSLVAASSVTRCGRRSGRRRRIPFGYAASTTPDPAMVRQEPDPNEASIVVEMFDRVAAGQSLTGIGKDFRARGITSRKGAPFSTQTLRGMLLAPVYAGRASTPRSEARAYRGDPEQIYDAQWTRLVSDDASSPCGPG